MEGGIPHTGKEQPAGCKGRSDDLDDTGRILGLVQDVDHGNRIKGARGERGFFDHGTEDEGMAVLLDVVGAHRDRLHGYNIPSSRRRETDESPVARADIEQPPLLGFPAFEEVQNSFLEAAAEERLALFGVVGGEKVPQLRTVGDGVQPVGTATGAEYVGVLMPSKARPDPGGRAQRTDGGFSAGGNHSQGWPVQSGRNRPRPQLEPST